MRFLLVIFFAISSPVFAQEPNPLVGTWKLISWESIVENESPQDAIRRATKRLPDHHARGSIDDHHHC